MTSTAIDPARRSEGSRPTPFSATLASEWTKLTTLRSTYVTVTLSLVLSLGATALAAVLAGATWDGWSAADRADFDPILHPLLGGILTSILLPILGVSAVAAEYSTGMIRLTLTATPRRGRVVLAKTAVVAAVTLVAGTIATVGMFLVGQGIFGIYGLDTASLADPDALRAVLAASALTPVFPVIAIALAVLLRSTAGAITSVLALIFIPAIVGPLLPGRWQEHLVSYLPGPASDSIATSHLEEGLSSLDPGYAVLVVAAWLALFLGAAYVTLMKRDA